MESKNNILKQLFELLSSEYNSCHVNKGYLNINSSERAVEDLIGWGPPEIAETGLHIIYTDEWFTGQPTLIVTFEPDHKKINVSLEKGQAMTEPKLSSSQCDFMLHVSWDKKIFWVSDTSTETNEITDMSLRRKRSISLVGAFLLMHIRNIVMSENKE